MNFEQFYKNSYKFIYKFFYYKLKDKSLIDDLAHDTYLRFYNKYLEKLSDETESTKILFGIAHNVYKEYIYKIVKENQVDFLDNYDYSDFMPDIEVENSEKENQKKLILTAINQLNDRVKSVIEYRFLYSMSRKEISEILSMSEKDVHKYQQRGIKYLKKILIKT